jgi:DNA-directed RNA polymerase specialized sigma24 family protein
LDHRDQELLDCVEIGDLLDELAKTDPRAASVVDMHCFGGLTHQEIGEVLRVDERTAKRDWQFARAWLRGRINNSREHVR